MPFRTEFAKTLWFEAVFAGVVFAAVLLVLGYALARYRSGRRSGASQDTEHPRLEGAYASVLVVAAAVVVLVTRGAMAADNRGPAVPPRTVVQVTGYQWCWQFHYLGTSRSVTASCQDGQYPTLVLPAGQPVRIETTSRDVIHSFWVPAFRFKMDAFPDHTNSFTLTVPHPGTWLGHCAEFCGEDHAFMTFRLRAVPVEAFDSWLTTSFGAGSLPA
ncbi:MAG: cytochrome c oxidase subunit II [Mycobacteriales bacterium]